MADFLGVLLFPVIIINGLAELFSKFESLLNTMVLIASYGGGESTYNSLGAAYCI